MGYSFPTQADIDRLRKQGIVSYSTWTGKLLAVLLVASSFYFSSTSIVTNFISYYSKIFTEKLPFAYLMEFSVKMISDLVILPILLVLLGNLFGILIQTKFYLSFDQIGLNLHRLSLKNQYRSVRPLKKLLFAICIPFFICISLLLSRGLSDKLIFFFEGSESTKITLFILLLKSITGQIVFVAVLLYILGLILNWFYFRLEHLKEAGEANQSSKNHAIDSVK